MYSENSKIVICLDNFFLNIFNYFGNLSTYISLSVLLNLPIYSISHWLLLSNLEGSLTGIL